MNTIPKRKPGKKISCQCTDPCTNLVGSNVDVQTWIFSDFLTFCRKLWWSSSRYSKDILGYVPVADWGILKTNSGREGVKMCKRFCARGLRGSVRPVLRPRAQTRLHIFDSPLLLGGGKKNRRHWPAHFGMWLRQKKVSWDEGQQNGNCQQAATAKIIFRLAAVHGPPRLGISSSQLETGKIYPSWPHRTTS